EGYEQATKRINRHADVIVLLQDQLSGRFIQAGIELRKLLESAGRGTKSKGGRCQLRPACLLLPPERIQLGDVRLVVLSDARGGCPCQGHCLGNSLPDRVKSLPGHFPPLAEFRQRWCSPCLTRAACQLTNVRLDVIHRDPT